MFLELYVEFLTRLLKANETIYTNYELLHKCFSPNSMLSRTLEVFENNNLTDYIFTIKESNSVLCYMCLYSDLPGNSI